MISRSILALVAAVVALLVVGAASAAPEAHILRIDPRVGVETREPILTTVIDVGQSQRVSDVVRSCVGRARNARFDCMSAALERPGALYTPYPFPDQNALLTVLVDGVDRRAELVSTARWDESLNDPGVGTAWLILIDADQRMGAGLRDAKQVAQRIIDTLGPSDTVDVQFFNDRQVVADSRWISAAQKSQAQAFLGTVKVPYPSYERSRSLFTVLKTGATDAFKALAPSLTQRVEIPLHQAMVVLSTGFGGNDPSTTGPGAIHLQRYLSSGRFPEETTTLPKMPVPVISILIPYQRQDPFQQVSLDFMQNLANPEIGGFFTVLRAGQGARADGIVQAIRSRFSWMRLVRWRVSCLAARPVQTFRLVFDAGPIAGESFENVMLGIDPASWPLDVDLEETAEQAKDNGGVHPGGTFKLYGNFCWGTDKARAEVYFLRSGTPVPSEVGGRDIEQMFRTGIGQSLRSKVLEVSADHAKLVAPNTADILHASGDGVVVRMVAFDNRDMDVDATTAGTLIELPGADRATSTTPPTEADGQRTAPSSGDGERAVASAVPRMQPRGCGGCTAGSPATDPGGWWLLLTGWLAVSRRRSFT